VKIVLAGDWHSNVHERPMAEALTRLGHTVARFAWHEYLSPTAAATGPRSFASGILRKAQNKYLLGPVIRRVNRELVELVERERPDLLFIYRGTHVTAATLRRIRAASPETFLVGYNNDDPFADGQPRWPWRHFVAAIPEYDRVLAYRRRNITDLIRAGARSTGLLLPWFVESIHRPLSLTSDERKVYGCDVVFVGHFESDGRLACLERLAESGIHLKIYGPGRGFRGNDWNTPLQRSASLRHLAPTAMVWGADYARALCGAKIALCFMSKRNRDTYTRRCFEIPATRTLLMSEYSEDLAGFFREGLEADFFRSADELVTKVQMYLADADRRLRVAAGGYARAFADGHDIDARMRTMARDLPTTLSQHAG
jgi:hypothetical protein